MHDSKGNPSKSPCIYIVVWSTQIRKLNGPWFKKENRHHRNRTPKTQQLDPKNDGTWSLEVPQTISMCIYIYIYTNLRRTINIYIPHDIDIFVIMETSSGGVSFHHFENIENPKKHLLQEAIRVSGEVATWAGNAHGSRSSLNFCFCQDMFGETWKIV